MTLSAFLPHMLSYVGPHMNSTGSFAAVLGSESVRCTFRTNKGGSAQRRVVGAGLNHREEVL